MSTLKKIACVALALAYGASLFSLAIPYATRDDLFVSPDEHATWAFAQSIAETGVAKSDEARNISLHGMLHPRSTTTVGAAIVPAGFLGMPYIAGLLFFFSPYLAVSTGPIFCILGLCALYGIIRRLGGSQEFALLSVVALAVHPAWWYYSIRSLMPNVPFVALLLIAVWMVLVAIKKENSRTRYFFLFCAGGMFASALAIRPSEWVWIIGGVLGVGCWGCHVVRERRGVGFASRHVGLDPACLSGRQASIAKKLSFCDAIALFLGCGIMIGITLFLHASIYGSPFITGYTVSQPVWEVGGTIAQGAIIPWYEKVFAILFPFGFHERATLKNVWRYVFALYPWMTVVGVGGVGCLVWGVVKKWIGAYRQQTADDRHSQFTVLFCLLPSAVSFLLLTVSLLYLLILYGSWTFFDNPDPSIISLGNSHTRYWLPVFVALAPATAYALLHVKNFSHSFVQRIWMKKIIVALPLVCIVGMTLFSAHLVFTGDDGVLRTREALATFAEKQANILASTPKDAIIIVDRADKYLWPDRAVIVPLRDEKTYRAIPELLATSPLYYFGITFPQSDLAYLHDVVFAQENIIFTPVITLNEETLYAITRE